MNLKTNCPICDSEVRQIYYSPNIPVFQNKVYTTPQLAKQAITEDMVLKSCQNCGMVFNSAFSNTKMDYDEQYQNEQAYSPIFQNYLSSIVNLCIQKSFQHKKIIEVGCGKGYF